MTEIGADGLAVRAPARDYTENSFIGVRQEDADLGSRDPDMEIENEVLSRSGANLKLIRVGAAAGLLFVLAVIGSTAVLAWRAHIDVPLIAEAQRQDVHDLQAAIQRLEQIAQRVDALQQAQGALQQAQQRNERSRLADVQRLSENLTSLNGRLETVAKSASKQETQKRSSAAGAAPKSQASNTPRSDKQSGEVQN